MPDPALFFLFLGASLALLLTPGPAVLYIVSRSLDEGRGAGLLSTLGLGVGGLVHVAAAAVGVSALLLSSSVAFTVLKLLGAAYLVFLGIRTLFFDRGAHPVGRPSHRGLRRAFAQGVIVNIFNPKTALFFLAFLPQFVSPDRPVTSQILVLGFSFVLLGVLSDSLFAVTAGTLGGWIRRNPRVLSVQRKVTGVVYLGLGALTALAGAERK